MSRAQIVATGKDRLRRDLETTRQPGATILNFRSDHDLKSRRCDCLLELMKLMKNSRSEAYLGLLESLVKELEALIPSMSKERQIHLLRQSFPFLNTSEHLRAIPICLLKQTPEIPLEYLNEFALNHSLQDVLSKMPLSCQQQVWETEAGLHVFESRILPMLDAYAATLGQKHLKQASAAMLGTLKIPSDKWRALSRAIKAVLDSITNRPRLVSLTLSIAVNKFAAVEPSRAGDSAVWAAFVSDMLLATEIAGHGRAATDKRIRLAKALDLIVRNADFLPSSLDELQKALKAIFPANLLLLPAAAPPARIDSETLLSAWNKLVEFDHDSIFALPVTDSMARGYSSIIKRPMDLTLMRSKIGKLSGDGYSSLDEFHKDVELMIGNCKKFNQKDSSLGAYASEFQEKWKKERARSKAKGLAPTAIAAGWAAPPPAALPLADRGSVVGLPVGPLLHAETIGNSPDVALAFVLLAQPAVVSNLAHALAAHLEQCHAQRLLPSAHPLLPATLQLLQMASSARAMIQAGSFAVPPPSPATLRLHLPLLQRLLGEAGLVSGPEALASVDCLADGAAWGNALSRSPALVRPVALSLVGAALSRPWGKLRGDSVRTVALLRLLGQTFPDDDARAGLADGLAAAHAKPVFTHSAEAREAALEAALAHPDSFVKLASSWVQQPLASGPKVDCMVERLLAKAASGEEGVRPSKRPKASEGGASSGTSGAQMGNGLFSRHLGTLKALFPALDIDALFRPADGP